MQTSLKVKTCSRFFIAFLECTLNWEYFEKKKDQSHCLSITEIINCETVTYLKVEKAMFHVSLPQITCQRVPNTAETSTEPDSTHSSINFR